jgi:hypothetical protein
MGVLLLLATNSVSADSPASANVRHQTQPMQSKKNRQNLSKGIQKNLTIPAGQKELVQQFYC